MSITVEIFAMNEFNEADARDAAEAVEKPNSETTAAPSGDAGENVVSSDADALSALESEFMAEVDASDNLPEESESDGTDGQQAAEKGEQPPKAPQFRIRPTTEVDALALDIVKRAQVAGKPMSLADAVKKAQEILGESPSQTSVGQKSDPVADLEQKIRELRAERKKAMTEALDFEKAAELEEQIESLREQLFEAKLAAKTKAEESLSKEKAAFEKQVQQAEELAQQLYPDFSNKSSALYKKMLEIDAVMRETRNPILGNPKKNLLIAQMAANELGIAPKTTISPAASVGKKTTPAPIASGRARTTQKQTADDDIDVDSIKSEEDFEKVLEAL
jgi:hypothetical protein